ncbi:hypothetical protein GGI04_002482 [Coemansia thaxteri]|nr:hypothetical protein GGI04_002482 [Coemansia thaxteri]
MGDYLLTLVDTLDTLAVLGDKREFERGVKNTLKFLPNFDINSHVQVFEVTIRMLGGLLSAHIIATDEADSLGMRLDINGTYAGELLHLARDLGYRLLPAFEASPNGIPYPRTNLKYGFARGETSTTCTAGVGTLLLEFGVLSRLTNETIFEDIARSALNDVWSLRSKKNLFGSDFDLAKKRWHSSFAGIGAGVDSLFEYMLKSHVYFGDQHYLDMFEASYAALLQYGRDTVGGYAFFNVDMHSAEIASSWIDSLSAFFPGLMVLAGDVEGAESAYMLYYHIWRRFRAFPERFNLFLREPDISFYSLRPEFIESTYFLYRATRDPFYLDVGEMVLDDLNKLQRTACGYATMHNVKTKELEERMESFFLSETLKYLYLLFDEDNPLHSLDNNYVFTTEAHVLLPLSPVREAGSAQYPRESSSSTRKLIHSERPPSAVKPLFYVTDNIRKKLQRTHPDDMFSMPAFAADEQIANGSTSRRKLASRWNSASRSRQCPAPRALTVRVLSSIAARLLPVLGALDGSGGDSSHDSLESLPAVPFEVELKPLHQQSPLAQLYVMRELSRAISNSVAYSPSQREYLVSLYVNGAKNTLPLRADFFSVGALVDNGSQVGANGSVMASVAEAYTRRLAGTTVLSASLDMALESLGVCIRPSLLLLSGRHEVWASDLLEREGDSGKAQLLSGLPREAETWLSPNTRQISFMELLLSRATNGSILAWNIPHQPKVRRGVPLLKDVWDEELNDQQPSEAAGPNAEGAKQKEPMAEIPQERRDAPSPGRQQIDNTRKRPLRRRGYYVAPEHIGQQQRQVVITNGAGQVMTDYVVVRASTDASLQEFARALPVHNDSITSGSSAGGSAPLPGAVGGGASQAAAADSMRVKADGAGSVRQYLKSVHGSGGPRSRLHPLSRDVYRRREYVGRLADFAEMALYHGQMSRLVSQPTPLTMLHLYSSSAAYGCEEYTPREQRMAKGKVVAARVGGGCTVWEKAIHATNAGASALLVDWAGGIECKDDAEHNCEKQNQLWRADGSARMPPPLRCVEENLGACLDGQHNSASCPPLAGCDQLLCLNDDGFASEKDGNELPKQDCDSKQQQALAMPVVIVSSDVIGELEEYLVAGLHVRVELL